MVIRWLRLKSTREFIKYISFKKNNNSLTSYPFFLQKNNSNRDNKIDYAFYDKQKIRGGGGGIKGIFSFSRKSSSKFRRENSCTQPILDQTRFFKVAAKVFRFKFDFFFFFFFRKQSLEWKNFILHFFLLIFARRIIFYPRLFNWKLSQVLDGGIQTRFF